MDQSTYPENVCTAARPLPVVELIEWEEGGLRLILMHNGAFHSMPAWWNGYVRFPMAPVPLESGLLDAVPVHGGVTFKDMAPDGSACYGFDCNHAVDHVEPKGERYVRDEVRLLARGLALAVPYVAAAAALGGFPPYLGDDELAPGLGEIRAAYGEQAHHLVKEGTAPLPADFWARTRAHPWFTREEIRNG